MPSECYKEILESAVLEACEDEYARICNYDPSPLFHKQQKKIKRSISVGLECLVNLTDGKQPDYDHVWVPLLHASWYHLRHVNFLQTELADRLKRYTNQDEIRVIDYGCGTMPVMWAIALVLADPENKLTHQKVSIYNHDTSKAMKKMGYTLYTKLKEAVENKQDLDEGKRLYDAISRVTESMKCFRSSDAHLLTAIHCLYDTAAFEKLKLVRTEDKCVTLHRMKAKRLGLAIQKKDIQAQWSGEIEKLTIFRSEKMGNLCSDNKHKSLLESPVKWEDIRDVVLVSL